MVLKTISLPFLLSVYHNYLNLRTYTFQMDVETEIEMVGLFGVD